MMGSAAPVMAITVLYATHYPRHKILLFFILPVEIWLLVTAWVALNLFQFSADGFRAGEFTVSLAAIGYAGLYRWSNLRFESLVPGGMPKISLPRNKPKLRVFEPTDRANLDQEVDTILTKISEQG